MNATSLRFFWRADYSWVSRQCCTEVGVMEELFLVVLLRAQAAALLTEKPRADVSRQRGHPWHTLWAKERSLNCAPCWSCSSVTSGEAVVGLAMKVIFCMHIFLFFSCLGINKKKIRVSLLLSNSNSNSNLSLRIGKLPETCVQNWFLFPPSPKQLKVHHFIANCSRTIPVHSFKTALKPFKQS